jgi:poly(beta-D-mannuronate) lyase
VILVKGGIYSKPCRLAAKGTADKPIVIKAETIGGVEMQAPLTIQGGYLQLIGFHFTKKGSIRIQNGIGCRVSHCHFENIQQGKWLTVDEKSKRIELDHCLFENKTINRKLSRSCQTVQFTLTNKNERHHIHHNHFRDIPKGKTGNGFETLQLITKDNPKDPKGGDTGNVIEDNLFESCDGEAEIISVKSNGNLLRGNTFLNSKGSLVLRQGHRNVVNGNWFIGGSGGVRIQGKNQKVINNYFQDLSSGLSMMNGIGRDDDVMYVRVENALIAHNTFINCKKTFQIGLNHSQYPPGTVPRACVIANNIFYNENSSEPMINLLDSKEPEEWTWQHNIVQATAGIPARDGLRTGDVHLKRNPDGIMQPSDQTPVAIRPEIAGNVLDTDITGAPRPEMGTLGAIQFTGGSHQSFSFHSNHDDWINTN